MHRAPSAVAPSLSGSSSTQPDCDVALVGGGVIGLAAALALSRCGYQVQVLERGDWPALPSQGNASEVWDSRVLALSPASLRLLEALGVLAQLDSARCAPVYAMQISGDDALSQLGLSAYESGVEELCRIVENSQLRAALLRCLQQAPGVRLVERAELAAMEAVDGLPNLILADGQRCAARLVLAADGAQSRLRELAGIAVQRRPYAQVAVVANFQLASAHPHRDCARQWFLGDSILAWLPLPGQRMAMVWSTTPEHAQALLAMDAPQLCAAVALAGGLSPDSLQLLTAAVAHPLQFQSAASMTGPRLLLLGDAAHVVHPLAGQGANLGFADVAALYQTLCVQEAVAVRASTASALPDPGARHVLRRVARARAEDVLRMQWLTEGLMALFASDRPGVRRLRNAGLRFCNALPFIKTLMVRQAAQH